MSTAKIFQNGGSQAVRLPREFQFDGSEVGIRKIGDVVVLFPRERAWDILAASLGQFSEDFMATRDQGEPSENRPGL